MKELLLLTLALFAMINNRENEVEEIHYYYKNLFNLIKFYNSKPINKVLKE